MKVFPPLLSLLLLFQNPACFLVSCAPVSIEHDKLPAAVTVKHHAIFTYPSLHEICPRWRASSTQRPLCRRVRLDRTTAAQTSQEQTTESLKSAAPPSTTALIASSLQHEDKGPAMTRNSSLDWRTFPVSVHRTLEIVVTSLRRRGGSAVTMLDLMRSSDDDLILTGLILSVMMQIMLVYWIWKDARVSEDDENP